MERRCKYTMKKGWKIFWIICAVLAAIGIFLAVAGTALGGLALLRDEQDENIVRAWMDRLGIRISNEVTVTSDVSALPDGEYAPGEINGTDITSYSGIDELDLELTGMSVCVTPYDEELEEVYGDDIVVDTSQCRDDLKDKIAVTQDGSELQVHMEDRGRLNTQDTGIMYISVPQGICFEKITADAKAGLIKLSKIEARELEVKTDAGQIIASAFSTEQLEAECGVGQIIFKGEVTGSAELNCNIGEVLCTLPGAAGDYDYELKCAVGELTIDGESYSGLVNKKEIDNGSGCRIKAECDMGNVNIDFE